jgi:anthranilate phosphoribosyltransferase
MITQALHALAEGHALSPELAGAAMLEIMSGRCSEAQIGAFLMGLRIKGETIEELTAMARALRAVCVPVRPRVTRPLLDVCGTGGAPLKTFNVSTVSAFVAAGAGVLVAKHGNRSVTSQCGSADLLEALGITLHLRAPDVARAIETIGIGFLFAPQFHPAMQHVAQARRELGLRTVFNLLGPLVNPAPIQAHLLGVFSAELVELYAQIVRNLGIARALVVYGVDGVDEVSITGPTLVAELRDNQIRTYTVTPEMFELRRVAPEAIAALAPHESATLTHALLQGTVKDARYEMVLLNAGAAIYLGGGASSWEEGLQRAAESIVSGRAWEKLENLRALGRREEAITIGPP